MYWILWHFFDVINHDQENQLISENFISLLPFSLSNSWQNFESHSKNYPKKKIQRLLFKSRIIKWKGATTTTWQIKSWTYNWSLKFCRHNKVSTGYWDIGDIDFSIRLGLLVFCFIKLYSEGLCHSLALFSFGLFARCQWQDQSQHPLDKATKY